MVGAFSVREVTDVLGGNAVVETTDRVVSFALKKILTLTILLFERNNTVNIKI